jgi:hypothetical protein
MTNDLGPDTGPQADAGFGKARPSDELFEKSLASLSQRLGERSTGQASPEARAAAEKRRAALLAYDLARTRRLLFWVAGGAGVTIATACVTWMIVLIATPSVSPTSVAQTPVPQVPIEQASVQDTPATLPPRDAAIEAAAGVTSMAAAAALPDKEAMSAPTTSQPAALPRAEVREIQTRLQSFGFDPGPIDGAAGRKTQEAAARYRQSRGAADSGALDGQLLDQLRRDPAPPLPPPPTQVAQGRAPPAPARPSNPLLSSVRTASDRLSQWLNSIGH